MATTSIMTTEQVRRTLRRLAYEVVERNRGAENLAIVGIRQRGTALARALAGDVSAITGRAFQVGMLDVARYRDDREGGALPEDRSDIQEDVTDRDVVLVDDVLFTGRTARAALDAIVRYGRPRSIQLAVLVDRGHREYPIQADYIGRAIPTKHRERVVVQVADDVRVEIVEDPLA